MTRINITCLAALAYFVSVRFFGGAGEDILAWVIYVCLGLGALLLAKAAYEEIDERLSRRRWERHVDAAIDDVAARAAAGDPKIKPRS